MGTNYTSLTVAREQNQAGAGGSQRIVGCIGEEGRDCDNERKFQQYRLHRYSTE